MCIRRSLRLALVAIEDPKANYPLSSPAEACFDTLCHEENGRLVIDRVWTITVPVEIPVGIVEAVEPAEGGDLIRFQIKAPDRTFSLVCRT